MARAGCLAAALAAAALLAAAAFVWFIVLADDVEPATVGDAVTTFREQGATGGSPVPEGVYVYATDGGEDTDALTGVAHRYPSRSTITVTGDECGLRMRWDVLDGRSTTWAFCVTDDGWTLESQDERHTFFGTTEATTYTCSDLVFRPAGDRPGDVSEGTCEAGSTDERTTARVVDRRTVEVHGTTVETVHLERASTFAGEIRGSSTHDFWLDRETGVPVLVRLASQTTNDSPVGDVRYDEEVSLRLLSLTPLR